MSKVVRDICPTASGRQGLAARRRSRRDRAALHPAQQSLHGLTRASRRTTSPARRTSAPSVRMKPGPGGNRGEFTGLGRARRRKPAWTHQRELPGLERRARHRRRRRLLRNDGRLVQGGRRPRPASCCGSSRPAPGSSASRSTYRGPDGKQYVAILSGVGGWAGAVVAGDLDPRDGTAALGFVNAMKDLKDVTTQGRHALCVPRCLSAGCVARLLLALALARQCRARASCASAPIPTTCRSRTRRAKASRTRSSI